MHAFIDHGCVSTTIDMDLARAQDQWSLLQDYGVDVVSVAEKLEKEGLDAFVESFENLMDSLMKKSRE